MTSTYLNMWKTLFPTVDGSEILQSPVNSWGIGSFSSLFTTGFQKTSNKVMVLWDFWTHQPVGLLDRPSFANDIAHCPAAGRLSFVEWLGSPKKKNK